MVVTGNPNIKAARRLEMGKSLLVLCALVFVPASLRAQTSGDLAAKYLAVSAYEVRPGVLMTVKYAGDGQACEMTLEKRHSTSKDKDIDIGSNIPAKVIDELSDELAPEADRGLPRADTLARIHMWPVVCPTSSGISRTSRSRCTEILPRRAMAVRKW
jgi:hypothetical protein